jgi:large subunit ribosomal protein L6
LSRIGKQPITIPANVTIQIEDGGDFGYKFVHVKGPKGELKQSIKRGVNLKVEDSELFVERANDSKQNKSFHGLYRTLIQNMVLGVTEGFSKSLEIVGIGYRAEFQGQNLVLSLGYSHKINFVPPTGININVQDQNNITIEGADKQLVGEIAAKLRSYRSPEPYKGKGIRYKGEQVRRKSTKGS